IHKNIWFLAILLFEIGCQILIIFVGGATFNVRRISGRDWGISIVAGLVSWPLGIVTRLIPTKPIEDLMIRLKLMKDSKELPTKMAKTSTESLAAEWNEPAIGEIAKQIGTFSRIRGGRLRASNLVLKSDAKFMRENDVHPQQIMAMVPALVGT
ncbi:cation transporting ATPase C-terminal domain-containing protein, partial [Bacillus tropicus]